MIQVDKRIIQAGIDHYGVREQLGVVQEELAELIQAISKWNRAKDEDDEETSRAVQNLKGETADVIICLETLKRCCNISEESLNFIIKGKQERLLRRMFGDMYEDFIKEGSENETRN